MADGLIIEPISIDFDIQIPVIEPTQIFFGNSLKPKAKAGVSKLEIQAQVKQLIEVKNLTISQVATTLCVAQIPVRRICRTLKIGPYRAQSASELRPRSSQLPFGWKLVRGNLEKEHKEWRIVILMNEFRDQGKSLHKIADELTRLGIPTKNNGKWFAKTISQVLKFNEKFLDNQQTDRRIT